MRANGMPAELLLPWRTTAAMLGGAEYLGQMQLAARQRESHLPPTRWPGRDGRLERRADAGNSVSRQRRAAHRHLRPHDDAAAERPTNKSIDVGPPPTFVLGLHEAITRWRMALTFEKQQVPSIFSKPHPNSLHFKNFFPQGVGGSLRIVVPAGRDGSRAS